jgi:hypothetical protein
MAASKSARMIEAWIYAIENEQPQYGPLLLATVNTVGPLPAIGDDGEIHTIREGLQFWIASGYAQAFAASRVESMRIRLMGKDYPKLESVGDERGMVSAQKQGEFYETLHSWILSNDPTPLPLEVVPEWLAPFLAADDSAGPASTRQRESAPPTSAGGDRSSQVSAEVDQLAAFYQKRLQQTLEDCREKLNQAKRWTSADLHRWFSVAQTNRSREIERLQHLDEAAWEEYQRRQDRAGLASNRREWEQQRAADAAGRSSSTESEDTFAAIEARVESQAWAHSTEWRNNNQGDANRAANALAVAQRAERDAERVQQNFLNAPRAGGGLFSGRAERRWQEQNNANAQAAVAARNVRMVAEAAESRASFQLRAAVEREWAGAIVTGWAEAVTLAEARMRELAREA